MAEKVQLSAEREARRKAEAALWERNKELRCLRTLSQILQHHVDSPGHLLAQVVAILPPAWQYADDAVARMTYLDDLYQTSDLSLCSDAHRCSLTVHGSEVGWVEVGYLSKHPDNDEGPFLKEERELLETVSEALGRAIERKLSEQALSAQERSYRLLAENTIDAIWSADLDMTLTYLNPAIQSIIGYTPEEMVGTSLSDYVDHTNLALLTDAVSHDLAMGPGSGGQLVEAVLRRKDGLSVPVEISWKALYNQDGIPIALQGIARDISERRRNEEALRRSEERHRHLFETMAQGSVFLDDEGKFIAFNPAAVRILGRSPEELMRSSCYDPIWDPLQSDGTRWPAEERPIELALRTGQPVERVVVGFFNPQDNDYRWLRLSAIPQPRIDKVSSTELNVTFEDITALRRAEEHRHQLEAQLQKAQRLEAVGRLAGGIAHDFNNMLSIILGNTQIALSQPENSAHLQAELLEIQDAAKTSAKLTQQLLAFARLQETTPQHLDLNQCVEASVVMLKSLLSEEITLRWEPSSAPVPVTIDPAQLDRILVNLTQNARAAIPSVGFITIKTELKRLNETSLAVTSTSVRGLYAVLTVSDTGMGMDKETLSRVFEPFFSSKPKDQRSGLGLATIHGIVEQNGGFTNIYSEPGEGTVVRVYLPRAQEDTAVGGTTQTFVDTDSPKGGDETILLVEDERSLLTMATRILKRLGYRVLPAHSPDKALELFREHSDDIDLLLTDVVMPNMNGHEMFLQMSSLKPGLRVLFMSGYTFDILARRGVDETKLNLLAKPFSIVELGHKVREALGS